MKRHWFLILLLTVLSVYILRAFSPTGFFKTHDGDFHLIRLDHFMNEMARGQFPVRLGTELAEGYGYPAFNYFYPLPYLSGAVFRGLGFSLGESLKAVMVLSTIVSGLACYWWLLRHSGRFSALVGGSLYLLAPYRLVSLYVTGQIGTITAFVWMPLLLAGIYDMVVKSQRRWTIALVAISLAGLLLSHINTLILCSPLILMYLVILALTHLTKRADWLWLVIALGLGLGTASFYLWPSLLEKSWVRMGNTVFVQYTDHWPTFKQLLYSPWGYGYSGVGPVDGMSFQIGMAQWVVIGLSVLAVVWQVFRNRFRNWKEWVLPTAILVCLTGLVFLMLPVSNFLWRWLQPMQYLQYPWRWLSSMVLLTSFLAAWLTNGRLGKLLGVSLLLLALFNVRNYLRSWEPTRYPDEFYTSNSTFYRGSSDISWEALPVGVPTSMIPQGPAASLIATHSATQTVISKFYLPLWQVKVDGQTVPTFASQQGLLTIDQVVSESQVSLSVEETVLEKSANWLTLISLGLLGILGLTNWSESAKPLHSPTDSPQSSAQPHRARVSKKKP